MMEKFILANEIIDSLSGNEDIEFIKLKLKEAYALSYLALDAITLLSRMESDYYLKVNMLVEAIDKVKDYPYVVDSLAYRQYLRAYLELLALYKRYQRPVLAYQTLVKLNNLKDNVFNIHEDLYAYEVYFNKEHTFSLDNKALESFLKSIECYAHDDYREAKGYLLKFIEGYPLFIEYLKDENEDIKYQDIAQMMKRFSFLINQNGGYLYFCMEVACD